MPTLQVPAGYSLVLASAAATAFLTTWQGIVVSKARRKAGIPYPQGYAERSEMAASKDAVVFNCAQRAHLNTLEVLPGYVTCLLISGLVMPQTSAGLGALFIFSRIAYTLGYITGIPEKRVYGVLGGFPQYLIPFFSLYSSYALYMRGL
ncbi:hypothetical protein B0H21DRAFT_754317 [Amylocystis lapponica]|nr:hypothetical protein B0H21DRAFT_754317 [Amylocystis lapponica]